MLTLRRGSERGYAGHGWLRSYHSFSFAECHDPRYMGFGALRVINEDRVAPGTGFGTHGHRDMEIVSYVLDGERAHKDSMGNGSVIRRADVQRMSAGTGVMHSEFNHAPDRVTHSLRIWLEPDRRGLSPSYEQKRFEADQKRGRLRLIASPDGAEGSVTLHQDARLYAGLFDSGETAVHALAPGRRAYVHLIRGALEVNGAALAGGDAAMLREEAAARFASGRAAELLRFDLR